MLIFLSHFIQILAIITGAIKFRFFKLTYEKLFLLYIVFVVINDIIAKIMLSQFNIGNYVNYNLYDIVTYLFFIFWFYRVLDSKKGVLFFGLLYIISLVFSLYYESFLFGFLNINVFSGTILMLVLVMIYYASLIKKPEVIKFLEIPEFWIATGMLVFNIGYLPILIYLKININEPVDVYAEMLILNILMYGSFLKAFLCYKKTQK